MPHEVCYQWSGPKEDRMVRTVSGETRQDLLQVVRERYRAGTKEEKRRILDEMVAVTGYHRKHVIRLLPAKLASTKMPHVGMRRLLVYDEAGRSSCCGKRPTVSVASDSDRCSPF